MRGLSAIQAALKDALRRPASLVGDPAARAAAERIATGNDRLSPVEQVDIYREQFFLRHVDCLRDDFKSIAHLVGEGSFEALCHAYLEAHPPESFTLRDLGHAMVGFVAERAPWSEDPLVHELARVEWAFVEAFDGPDAPPFDPQSVAGAPEDAWPGARIVLAPSLQRLALAHPSHDYRIAVHKGEAPPRPEARPCKAIIYRGPDTLRCYDVEPDAFALLEELSRGVALGEACERAAAASEVELGAFQGKLGGWFSDWTALGWIAKVDL